MPKIPTLVEMLQAGVHFGHQTSRWHPKMDEYIFSERGGVHIIDLEKTQKELESALEYVKGIVARGGTVLFLGTKKQAKDIVKKYAEDCGMPYVTERWLGGTLTNYDQIKLLIRKYRSHKDKEAKGEFRKYTKKEQLLLSREIEELDTKVGGIESLDKVPEALFVVDIRREKTAVQEAQVVGTKIIAICDSNVNPTGIDKVIPANDDAVKSIEMITSLVSRAIKEAKAEVKPAARPVATKKTGGKKPDSEEFSVKQDAKAAVDDLDEKLHEEVVAAKQAAKKSK